jgi:hypothetical protein
MTYLRTSLASLPSGSSLSIPTTAANRALSRPHFPQLVRSWYRDRLADGQARVADERPRLLGHLFKFPHLGSHVRELEIVEVEDGYDSSNYAEVAFDRLLAHTTKLRSLNVDGPPTLLFPLFSPPVEISLPPIPTLVFTSPSDTRAEATDLLHSLSRLTSLSSLYLQLHPTTSHYLHDFIPPFEPTRLRKLGVRLSPASYLASDFFDRLVSLYDPTALEIFDIDLSFYYPVASTYLPLCTSPVTLRIDTSQPDLLDFLDSLPSSVFPFLLSVRNFRLWSDDDSSSSTPSPSSHPRPSTLTAFLQSLPPSLVALAPSSTSPLLIQRFQPPSSKTGSRVRSRT